MRRYAQGPSVSLARSRAEIDESQAALAAPIEKVRAILAKAIEPEREPCEHDETETCENCDEIGSPTCPRCKQSAYLNDLCDAPEPGGLGPCDQCALQMLDEIADAVKESDHG